MPRKNSKTLTDPGIGKIGRASKGKRAERFDALAPGLCLRVTDNGTKSWSVYYRFAEKHQRMTIGGWPEVTVAEARERAREIKRQARTGIDPKTVRQAAADAERAEAEVADRKTFGRIAEIYITRECSRLARGGEYEAVIRRELLPKWSSRQMTDLRRGDLTEITDALIDAGKPMAAHKIHEIVKRIFNWSVDRGDLEASCFSAMKPPVKKEPRSRVLSDPEIEMLWGVWADTGYPVGPMMQMLLLTGQRRTEVAAARWREVDLEEALWTIPARRVKMKRDHCVPLSPPAISILETLPRFNGGDFVFSTTSGRTFAAGFSKLKRRIDGLARVRARENGTEPLEEWHIHDLRRTVRTGMARLGVAEIVGERVLNHMPRGLARVYNVHEYSNEKREALARWAGHVAALVTPPPENVVKLRAEV